MPSKPDDKFPPPKPETGPKPEELEVLEELTRAATGADDPREALRIFLAGHWDKTVIAVNRIKESPFYEEGDSESPHGTFEGRKIIGRDTQIHGGVYVGEGMREAIVVDERHGELKKQWDDFISRRTEALQAGERRSFKDRILIDVYHFALEKMPYRKDLVEFINESYADKGDNKVALDSYLKLKGGVCRHQALFIAYMLEKMADLELLGGKVSVDRNYVPMVGGHAWVRYTTKKCEVFIIDTALKYIGKLTDLDDKAWFYVRPEDLD